MNFKSAVEKLFDSLTSVKFLIIVLSTWLFSTGKLSESGWMTMILTATGLREMGKMIAAYREVQTSKKVKVK